MTFNDFLVKHEACEESLEWKGDRDLKATWNECKRPDWMLWMLRRVDADKNTLRLLACDFVRHTPLVDGRVVWNLLTDERSCHAIEVAERHAIGAATDEELAAARDAARDAAWDSARDAAWAAARDAARDAAWDAAWDAARAAARAAAWDAARAAAWAAAWDAAWDAARAAQCDLIRARFTWEEVQTLIEGAKP